MADGHEQAGGATTQDQASDEEMRVAYEAELNRITSPEMILQTVVSLLNIGGRRLGLGPPPASGLPAGQPTAAAGERDLEQVRDAIDGASALLPILERRMPRELGPLRDAIAQLQVAYARETAATRDPTAAAGASRASAAEKGAPAAAKDASGAPTGAQDAPARDGGASQQKDGAPSPGPAQSSGRLWVPGR